MFRPFYSNDLRMVRLTTLPDQLCKELGTRARDNLGGQMVVNTRVELCGAFVNNIDITLVNYTVSREKKKERFQFSKFDVPKANKMKSSGPNIFR